MSRSNFCDHVKASRCGATEQIALEVARLQIDVARPRPKWMQRWLRNGHTVTVLV